MFAFLATTPLMRANTIELADCSQENLSVRLADAELFKPCTLIVEYFDEDGVTVQQTRYRWEYDTVEDCFAKIGEVTTKYEQNTTIKVINFQAQFD